MSSTEVAAATTPENSPRQDRVTIFSNGLADFNRFYAVGTEPTRIAIPVKTTHIADVLASLNIFGQVRLLEPPSFRPANEHQSNLTIDPHNALEGLLASLPGTQVRVTMGSETLEGQNLGMSHDETSNGGAKFSLKYASLLTETGLRRVRLSEILQIEFLDQIAQDEIGKALKRSFQEIKPDSTFVDVLLQASEPTEALLQYVVPNPAWKMSYRISQDEREGAQLRGYGIVDNDSDEDWKDNIITLATGEPISFETDLAEAKIPRRTRRNIVQDTALGAIEPERGLLMASEILPAGAGEEADQVFGMAQSAAPTRAMRRSFAAYDSAKPAETPKTATSEVGDFALFETADPVTVNARRSAVIPMFSQQLRESRVVLHYRAKNHPECPFRAVEFKNESGHALGTGACTVFQEGVFVGECVMPPTKPKEVRLLPHALETGVRIKQETESQNRQIGLWFSEGVFYTHDQQQVTTRYRAGNQQEKAYQLYLDHDHAVVQDSQATLRVLCQGEPLQPTEELRKGFRLKLELASQGEFTVEVVESRVHRSRTVFADRLDLGPLRHAIDYNGDLARDPTIAKCLKLQEDIDTRKQASREAEKLAEESEKEQTRLLKLIEVGDEAQKRIWRQELGENEAQIKQIRKQQIPTLEKEQRDLMLELRTALKALAVRDGQTEIG